MPTLTVDVTAPGVGLSNGGNSVAGHMWYTLTNDDGDTTSFGFEPLQEYSSNGPGTVEGTDNSTYNSIQYSSSVTITQDQYNTLLNFGDNSQSYGYNQNYNAITNNCVTFTWDALSQIGIVSPNAINPSQEATIPILDVANMSLALDAFSFANGNVPGNSTDDTDPFDSSSWNGGWNVGWGTSPAADGFDFGSGGDSWPDGPGSSDPALPNQNPAGQTGSQIQAGHDMNQGASDLDPLVLDLTGTGLNLTALSPTSTDFDYTGDGFANRTGWVGNGSGILVLDPGAGPIANLSQIITSFSQLAGLDSNGDGVINASDPAYQDLMVWVGSATSGMASGTGSLVSLADLGIESINVNSMAANQTIAGNTVTATGTFTLASGATQEIASVDFAYSGDVTTPDTIVSISNQVAVLPEVQGSGTLYDLRSAMMSDPMLIQLVASFASSNNTDPSVMESAAQAIMYQWAGVTDVDPNSVSGGTSAQVAFLDQYLGQSFSFLDEESNPTSTPGVLATADVAVAWNTVYDSVLARLVVQSASAQVVAPEFQYDAASGIVSPVSGLSQALQNAFTRLGVPTQGNWASWDLEFRLADAARLDLQMPQGVFEAIVVASTTDEIGSLANSVANGISISFDSNGQIIETGTALSDVLYAGQGISELVGGGGGSNHVENILSGDDFVYRAGDGKVEISETEIYGGTATNTLTFEPGISASQMTVRVSQNGQDLVLTDGITGDEITLDSMASDNNGGIQSRPDAFTDEAVGVQQVQFADGTILSATQLLQMATIGTSGSDTLYGSTVGSVFDGKGGNDLETGVSGADTFIYDQGYGDLEINEYQYWGQSSLLELGEGISASSLSVGEDSHGDIILTDGTSGDRVQIDGMVSNSADGVGEIEFADGTTLSRQQILNMATTGTTGSDTLYGASTGSVFDGKGGNDVEIGTSGADTFIYNQGYGDLEINEYQYWGQSSVLQLGAAISESSISVTGNSAGDIILTDGTSGDRVQIDGMVSNSADGVGEIEFADGTTLSRQQIINMMTTGTTGSDTLYGASTGSVFDGKGGGDLEIGISGADTFIFNQGYGDLEISEYYIWDQNSILQLGAGISESSLSVTSNGAGDIILTDGISGDRIQLDNMISYNGGLNGNNGVAEVEFVDGSVLTAQQLITMAHTVTGTTGADTLTGPAGADTFDGKGGNDLETGVSGADTFIYNQGYGDLEINEYQYWGQNSVLKLGAGISASSLSVGEDSHGDIILTDGAMGDRIQLDGMLSNSADGVAEIEFADGTTLSRQQIFNEATTGTIGSDTLYGASTGSVFDGKGGGDLENGISGADTFVFDQGYGDLEISEYYIWDQNSILQLGAGISESSVSVSSNSAGDIILMDGTSGDRIQLDNMISYNGGLNGNNGVAEVEFADDSVLTAQQLLTMAHTITGTTGADTLTGPVGADTFDGKGGDDVEIGTSGADTFIYNQGYGDLEINEYQYGGQNSVLQLGARISASSLTVGEDSHGDIILTDGTTGDQIQLDGMLSSSAYGVGEIKFADGTTLSRQQIINEATTGTTGSDTLYGASTGSVFDGKGGNDVEIGTSGADTFIYNQGYGDLEINEYQYWGQNSVLQLGAGISESSLSVSGNSAGDIILTDGTSGDRVQIDGMVSNSADGVAEIELADGTTLSRQQIINMMTTGTTGSDTLYGASTGSVFDGKGGNDVEIGISGADTFIFNQGYGDLEISEYYIWDQNSILQLGAGVSESSISVSGNSAGDIILTDGTSGDRIQLDNMIYYNGDLNGNNGVAEVEFADGSVLTAQQLLTMAHTITGTTGADTLTGPAGADTFDGKGGDDVEIGTSGADTFIYNQGYGNLEINEYQYWGQSSVLELGEGISASSLSVGEDSHGDIILTDGTTGDQIQLDGMLSSSAYGVGEIEFADGTTLSRQQIFNEATTGTIGSDTLYGASTGSVFDGKGGNDVEIGTSGADTFIYNQGYGDLEINEYQYWGQNSVLQLGAGISESSLSVSGNSAGDIILTDGISGDRIQLDNMIYYNGDLNVADGVAEVEFADGTTLSEAQLLQMAHIVTGTSGADTLSGPAGGDTFDGKGGNDLETGVSGSDTFIFNQGYGDLEINEYQYWGQNSVLELGAGINESSVSVSGNSAGDIIVTDGTTGDRIQLDGMLSNSANGVGQIEFADGTTLSRQQIINMATTGTTGSDTLYGGSAGGVFDGKGGGDLEIGISGADTFVFNQGYGDLEISEYYIWDQNSVLQLGAGISESSISVTSNSARDIVLTDGTTGDQIQIDNMISYNGSVNGNNGVAEVEFANGSVLTAQQLITMATPITGTTSAQTLTGTIFSDVFNAAASGDTEVGGGGNDTYMLQSGSGSLTIENGVSTNDVASGTLSILNESANDIWLKEVGNDLQVDIMGTQTEATIQGWFTNSYSQLNAITVSGSTGTTSILDSQLSQLVQAMATYSAQNPGFDPASSTNPAITDPNLLTLVNSSYHANL